MTPALQTKKRVRFSGVSGLAITQRTLNAVPSRHCRYLSRAASPSALQWWPMAVVVFWFRAGCPMPLPHPGSLSVANCWCHVFQRIHVWHIYMYKKSSNCREICQSPISSGYVCAFFGHCSVPRSWTNLFLCLDTTLSADVCFLAGCFSYKWHPWDETRENNALTFQFTSLPHWFIGTPFFCGLLYQFVVSTHVKDMLAKLDHFPK